MNENKQSIKNEMSKSNKIAKKSQSKQKSKKKSARNEQHQGKNIDDKDNKTETPKKSDNFVLAINQGASSTKAMVFRLETSEIIVSHCIEVKKIFPREGWIEMDAMELYQSVIECIDQIVNKLKNKGYSIGNIECIGISNQRETTIAWESVSGKPLYNAIVWNDNRTYELQDKILELVPWRDKNWFKTKTGLTISPCFSAMKIKWLIDNVPEINRTIASGNLKFGTVDSWIIYNMTGNHLTDVTNASRTLLMNLKTLQWDKSMCDFFKIPMTVLPKIQSCSAKFGQVRSGPLKGISITGVIGDQQASLIGQKCLEIGKIKASYGTGGFLMQNIGPTFKNISNQAKEHLLITVAYKFGNEPAVYALEGPISMAGATIQWFRDNIQLIKDYDQVEELAKEETNSGGLYFVPALQGLFAPYWDTSATGLIIGISQYSQRNHLIRAALDATAFQTNDIFSLIKQGANSIQIDGGMTKSTSFCQILANKLGIKIYRCMLLDSKLLGAAMVAANHQGHMQKMLNNGIAEDKKIQIFESQIDENIRLEQIQLWKFAVERSKGWNITKKETSSAKKRMAVMGRYFKKFMGQEE